MPAPLSVTEIAGRLDWSLLSREAMWTAKTFGPLLEAGYTRVEVAAYYGMPASEVGAHLARLRAEIMAIVQTGNAAPAADA